MGIDHWPARGVFMCTGHRAHEACACSCLLCCMLARRALAMRPRKEGWEAWYYRVFASVWLHAMSACRHDCREKDVWPGARVACPIPGGASTRMKPLSSLVALESYRVLCVNRRSKLGSVPQCAVCLDDDVCGCCSCLCCSLHPRARTARPARLHLLL